MNEFLDEVITDEKLVWDKTLMHEKQKFFVKLNSEIIQELVERRNELDNLNVNELPLLKNQILYFRNEILRLTTGELVDMDESS